MDKIPDLTLKTTDGVEPAVSKIISLIKESRAGHLCLLEEITVEESKLRGFQDLRRTFFGWVSHADGYKNQFARAEKAINRFLITDDTQQLSVELIKSGVQSTKAETVVADLAAAVLKLRALTYDTLPIADTADGPVEIEVAGDDEEADNVSILLTGRKTKVAVARPIWKDLRTRFHAFVPLAEPDLDDEELETLFTEYATWMRMKYMVLTGGRGGLQDCIPSEVMTLLHRRCGVRTELFSSPLNCAKCAPSTTTTTTTLPTLFCSLMPECDAVFGSLGSAFDLQPSSGTIEVNPPFTEAVFHATYTHMAETLAATEAPLGYVVVVPDWGDASGIVSIRKNVGGTLLQDIAVPKGEHAYRDGLSGAPSPPFLRDTLVFIMGNAAWQERIGKDALEGFKAELLTTWRGVPSCAGRKRKFAEV